LSDYHDPGEEGSLPATSNQAGEGEATSAGEELGKPPPLDPSMEDGVVAAPMLTPPVVGRVAGAAEPLPSPRERAVGAELRPAPLLPPPLPQTVGIPSSSLLQLAWTSQAHQIGDEEGASCRWMSGLGDVMTGLRCRWIWIGELRSGRWIWGLEMDLAQKTPVRPKLLEYGHRPLPARDPSAPSALGDEAVQRKLRRLLRLGARDRGVASRDDGEPVSRLGWGVF